MTSEVEVIGLSIQYSITYTPKVRYHQQCFFNHRFPFSPPPSYLSLDPNAHSACTSSLSSAFPPGRMKICGLNRTEVTAFLWPTKSRPWAGKNDGRRRVENLYAGIDTKRNV